MRLSHEIISQAVIKHRIAAGLTRAQLSRKAGLVSRTIRNIEAGKHAVRIETAARLAAACQTTIGVMFAEFDNVEGWN